MIDISLFPRDDAILIFHRALPFISINVEINR